MSYFSDLYGLVNYPIASEHSRGLRNAQIGAIHAIASHSTLEPVDAAVIVMPTGSGKTTVLMLAPYEVAQQAIKCTVWIKSKTALLTKIQARVKGSSTDKFIRGDLKTLKALLQSQKAMEIVIHIVQPAISKNSPMADPVGRILSAATFYIRHTGRAKELKIIGSH